MPARLSFYGAARTVTGSRYLLETADARVLVDCGLYQERALRDRNWAPFHVDPASIDAVLLTHAHLDHCGLLPKLVAEGFKGRVFCTAATAEIAPTVMEDSGRIQAEDARHKLRRHRREKREPRREIRPLYTASDAREVRNLFCPVPLGESVAVAPGVSATFHGAGHILGSSSIKLEFPSDGHRRSLVLSGDVGGPGRPIIKDPDPFPAADYVICESTYGDRDHEAPEEVSDRLAELISGTADAGGNVIIPSFAIERAQEVLYRLDELLVARRIPPLMVFLDSPMAVKVTKVFQRHAELYDDDMVHFLERGGSPFSFPGLKFVQSREDSKAVNRIRGTSIIIAGSGMCTGGRIKHHLLHNIQRPECAVLFVGYQASGTLGREIVDGAQYVRILGQRKLPVRARVAQIQGFSGHADRGELLAWLRQMQAPRQLFVTHGGENVTQKFAARVRETLGWSARAPEYEETVELT